MREFDVLKSHFKVTQCMFGINCHCFIALVWVEEISDRVNEWMDAWMDGWMNE